MPGRPKSLYQAASLIPIFARVRDPKDIGNHVFGEKEGNANSQKTRQYPKRDADTA